MLLRAGLFILTLCLCPTPTRAAEQRSVTYSEFAPLQTDVGFAEAKKKAEEWFERALNISIQKHIPVVDAVFETLKREANLMIFVYRSPDGKYRPTDAHHRILAAKTIMDRFSMPLDMLVWDVLVIDGGDFSNRSWKEFAEALEPLGLAYFSPKVLNESIASGESLADRFQKRLGNSFDDLRNNPLRSAIGGMFDVLGLEGSAFEPQVQLLLGERFEKLGFTARSGREYSPVTQEKLLTALFSEANKSVLYDFLISKALAENKLTVQRKLAQGATFVKSGHLCNSLSIAESTSSGLPSLIVWPASRSLFTQLFTQSHDGAQDLDLNRANEIIRSLANGKRGDFNASDKKFLKRVRQTALSLRSSYRLLSDQHEVPEAYRDFVKALGELNDAIALWNLGNKPAPELVDAANRVKSAMKKGILDDEFNPSSKRSFFDYQLELITRAERYVYPSELTVRKYHDLRKIIRDFKFLFTLLNENNWTPEYEATTRLLARLSKRMGTIKDGFLLEKPKRGVDPNDLKTAIDPVSKREILDFIDLMKRSLNSV